MDRYADKRDDQALERDKFAFSVLRRCLHRHCELILSDHERVILCYTGEPYPVWIWTADDMDERELALVYDMTAAHSLLDGAHSFNLKRGLASYFIRRSASEGRAMSVSMNLQAYACMAPVSPEKKADGAPRRCTIDDLETLVDFIDRFHAATGVDVTDRERYRRDALSIIASGYAYLWQNADGVPVASCKYGPNEELASVNLVYTRPEYRRRHYAQNLVYHVTKTAKDAGFIPVLYTDADYAASNACYQKVGFELRGELCTIR